MTATPAFAHSLTTLSFGLICFAVTSGCGAHSTGSRSAESREGSEPTSTGAEPAASAARRGTGTLLVANKAEATLSFVDLASGEVVATVPTGTGPHEVAVSPDGGTAAVADYGAQAGGSTLTVVDVPRARVVRTVELGEHTRPHGIAFLDDRRVAVTTEGSGSLLLVDVEAGKVETAVPTGQRVSHMVALDPRRERAYVANIGSGSMTVVDLAAGAKVADVATGAGAEGIAVSPADGRVWVTNREADTVTAVDPESLEVVATLPSKEFPIRAEATPDGRWVLVSNAESGTLTVIDARAAAVARTVDLSMQPAGGDGRMFDDFGASSVPIGIEIAPDGKTAWIAHANADAVQVVDLETWKPAGALTAGKEPDGMAHSPRTVERPSADRRSP